MDDNASLLTHMDDLARRAQKTGMAHSKFLTPAEAAGMLNWLWAAPRRPDGAYPPPQ